MSEKNDKFKEYQAILQAIASTQNPEKQNSGKKDPAIQLSHDDQTNQRVADLRD